MHPWHRLVWVASVAFGYQSGYANTAGWADGAPHVLNRAQFAIALAFSVVLGCLIARRARGRWLGLVVWCWGSSALASAAVVATIAPHRSQDPSIVLHGAVLAAIVVLAEQLGARPATRAHRALAAGASIAVSLFVLVVSGLADWLVDRSSWRVPGPLEVVASSVPLVSGFAMLGSLFPVQPIAAAERSLSPSLRALDWRARVLLWQAPRWALRAGAGAPFVALLAVVTLALGVWEVVAIGAASALVLARTRSLGATVLAVWTSTVLVRAVSALAYVLGAIEENGGFPQWPYLMTDALITSTLVGSLLAIVTVAYALALRRSATLERRTVTAFEITSALGACATLAVSLALGGLSRSPMPAIIMGIALAMLTASAALLASRWWSLRLVERGVIAGLDVVDAPGLDRVDVRSLWPFGAQPRLLRVSVDGGGPYRSEPLPVLEVP